MLWDDLHDAPCTPECPMSDGNDLLIMIGTSSVTFLILHDFDSQ